MFDFSLSKKNVIWGGCAVAFVFLFHGFAVSLFAAGLLFFASTFYWCSKKLNNNLLLSGVLVTAFSLVSLLFHGPYLTSCIFILLFSLLLSFNALLLLINDAVMALWSLVVVLIGLSFLPDNLQKLFTIIWLASVLLVTVFKFKKSIMQAKRFVDYIQNKIDWFDLLACFTLLLSTLFLAMFRCGYFWALDPHHPIYELSIGQSYRNALLNVPDLSYSGKIIKFHFLSTQISLYFSKILGISLLDALYTVSMFLFTFIALLLIPAFFNYSPNLKAPLFYVFFIPSFIFITDCAYRVTLVATISYIVAFLFMICALYFLIRQWDWLLFLCSVLLLLVKASFFMSLFGGIFIFWVFRERSLIKSIVKIMPFAIVFLVINYVFLSGAHAHNLWILMPSFMFHYTRESYFFCRAEALLGILFLFVALYLLIKDKNAEVQALAAVVVSGILGWLFCVELSEANSYQFVRAVYFPMSILIWYFLQNKFYDLIAFVHGDVSESIKKFLYNIGFSIISIGCLCYSAYFLLHSAVMVSNIFVCKNFSVNQRLIDCYSWFGKNCSQDNIMLFGSHYNVGPDFIRSAICGKQLYCEGFKAKGILMEEDYVSRVADSIKFYKKFVNLSDLSKQLLASFESSETGGVPGIPLSQSPAFSVRMLHYLSLGKEWHFVNRSKQVKFELGQALKEDNFSKDDAITFINQSKITHIVLENGDTPSDFLTGITKTIYSDGIFSVLEIVIN